MAAVGVSMRHPPSTYIRHAIWSIWGIWMLVLGLMLTNVLEPQYDPITIFFARHLEATVFRWCAWLMLSRTTVFSMGVILWEILTLEEPWKEHFSKCIRDPYQVIALVSNFHRLQIPAPDHTSIPEFSKLTDLIEDAWKENPNERPTMKQFHQRIFDVQKQLIHRLRKQNQVVSPP